MASLQHLHVHESWINLMCIALDWNAEGTSQSQVSYLETLSVIIYQQVLRLQIPMHDSMLMAVRRTLDQLIHEALHRRMTSS